MKVGILLSGGKDSLYAAYLVSKEHTLTCAISMISENTESYMFHTPNIHLTELQAKAMEIPYIKYSTLGKKEEELVDLENAICSAQQKYGITAIVTGALASNYQASRIQEICKRHGLEVLNPLWQMSQEDLIKRLVKDNFTVILSSIAAYGFDKTWLGRILDENAIKDLLSLQQTHGMQVAFEGGEAETVVTDCPLFSKRILIESADSIMSGPENGNYIITSARLEDK
ncbi:MAG: diphthine--ammonia ligase [Nanobdellota archaeon]